MFFYIMLYVYVFVSSIERRPETTYVIHDIRVPSILVPLIILGCELMMKNVIKYVLN